MRSKKYYVYIMTNYDNRVLYTGMTGAIENRIHQHKNKLIEGFTKKYNLNKLVFLQEFNSVYEALNGEKIIKGWRRSKKVNLISENNPEWKDLAEEL